MGIAVIILCYLLESGGSRETTLNTMEILVRILLSIAIVFSIALPAYADFLPTIPEPDVISLIGIGVLAVLISRRGKK